MAAVTSMAFDAIYGVQEADLCNRALGKVGAEPIRDTLEESAAARVCRVAYSQARNELLRLYPFNFSIKSRVIPRDDSFPYELDGNSGAYIADGAVTLTGTNATPASVLNFPADQLSSGLVGMAAFGAYVPVNARIISVNVSGGTITLDRPTTGACNSLIARIPWLRLLGIETMAGKPEEPMHSMIGTGAGSRVLAHSGGDSIEVKYVEEILDPSLYDPLFYEALVSRVAIKIAPRLTQSAQILGMLYSTDKKASYEARVASLQETVTEEDESWWTEESRT